MHFRPKTYFIFLKIATSEHQLFSFPYISPNFEPKPKYLLYTGRW